MCAFKLIKTLGGEANITSFCDYYGPSYPITISANLNGSKITISPQSAIVIAGGGCTKNRLVYNFTAADLLLSSPNNGSSKWLSSLQNATVAANSTRMGLAQAILQYAGGSPSNCEACGMTMDVSMQGRYKILDVTGTNHLACCPVCALKLLQTHGNLNITTFCDYYGTSYPITINSRNNGTDTTVYPPTALVILGGGCTKNRLVYNSTAADLLLAPPNNGTSRWLPAMSNDTVAANSTRMGVAQAAAQYGGGVVPSPSLSPTPSATASPTPPATVSPTRSPETTETPQASFQPSSAPSTNEPSSSPEQSASPSVTETPFVTVTPSATGVTQQCEICGMDVTPESQARYRVTDGNGNVHYVECFMCALQGIKLYQTVNIQTYCDWYGPNYPITINSTNYGQNVIVTPSTAMFLRGGSCVTARAAYNQTAADNLLANGYSQFTSPEQQYALPSTTQVKTVNDAIYAWYVQPKATTTPTNLILALAVVAGVVVVVMSVVAYKKIKR